MKRLTIILLIASSASSWGYTANDSAKTITSNNTYTDIAAAIAYVKAKNQDGWVLTSGTAGTLVDLGTNALSIDVGGHTFTWQSADPSNRATIQSTCTAGAGITVSALGALVTIKDFQFTKWRSQNGFIQWAGYGEVIHLTNCYANGTDGSNFFMWTAYISNGTPAGGGDGPFGLIDHCQFVFHNDDGFFIRQNSASSDFDWANNHSITWGTRNAVFFENNDFTADGDGASAGVIDGNQYCKLVVRDNVFHNAAILTHGRDSGQSSLDWKAALLSMEIYRNTFNVTVSQFSLIQARSGTAMVWGNTVTNPSGFSVHGLDMQLDCTFQSNMGAGEYCRKCSDGTLMTQPLAYPTDYPECQQPGTPQPIHVWGNANKNLLLNNTWISGSSGGAFYFFNQHVAGGYFVSDDDSAKPTLAQDGFDYVPLGSHPLDTGSVNSIPQNIAPPTVTGITTNGQVLASSAGTWSGFPAPAFTYQWTRCDESGNSCANISSATLNTYTLVNADIGQTIRCVVTGTNSTGSGSATSAATAVVIAVGANNVLVNPGFETRAGVDNTNDNSNPGTWAGWTSTNANGYVQSSTSSHSGSYAYKLYYNGFGGLTVSLEQSFAVTAGQAYSVSFWAKNDNANYRIRYSIVDVTHSTNIIAPVTAPSSIGSYTKVTNTFTAPTGCTSAKIRFDSGQINSSGGGVSAWVDDVVVAPSFPGKWIQLSCTNTDAGSLAPPASVTQTIVASNKGDTDLPFTNITSSDPNWTITSATSGTIPAGGSTSITALFAPSTQGSYSTTITVVCSPDNGTKTIPLTGTVVTPNTVILQFNNPAPDFSYKRLNQSVFENYAYVATQSITNTGNSTMPCTSITHDNPHFSGTFAGSIASGQGQNITFVYNAPAAVDPPLQEIDNATFNCGQTSGPTTETLTATPIKQPRLPRQGAVLLR